MDRAALHTLSAFVPLHKNRSLVILKQLDSEASTQLPSGDNYLPLGARSGLKGRSFKIKWDPLVRGSRELLASICHLAEFPAAAKVAPRKEHQERYPRGPGG